MAAVIQKNLVAAVMRAVSVLVLVSLSMRLRVKKHELRLMIMSQALAQAHLLCVSQQPPQHKWALIPLLVQSQAQAMIQRQRHRLMRLFQLGC